MSTILNVGAVHNNGKPELCIGIRGNEFIISLDSENNKITIKKLFTQKKLSLEIDELISTNTYTKDEIDRKYSGMMTYHGNYYSYQDVLDAISNGDITPARGWVVFVVAGGGTDVHGIEIPTNCHMLYNGGGWQIL